MEGYRRAYKKKKTNMKLTRILKEGDAGNDVKYLQSRLKTLKYFTHPTITGNFGGITTNSVKAFQKDNGLTPNGVVNNNTWYKLFENKTNSNTTPNINQKFPYKPSIITSNGLEIFDKILADDEYVNTVTKKKTIYLHHTAGGCFTGDTKIKQVSGIDIRISDMIKDEAYLVYGYNHDGEIIEVKAIALGETKRVYELIEVTLSNGYSVACTLDHKWLCVNNVYKAAYDLKFGDKLMSMDKDDTICVVNLETVFSQELVPVYDIYVESTSNFALSSGIFVHNSRPDWVSSSWDRDDKNGKAYKVATSYIIGRKSSSDGDETFDGKVFRAFDDKYWCYHLGVSGTNGKYDKTSIGIEVCNYGYCKLIDGKYINYVNREVPASDVVDLGKEFRGYRYWERYTDEQIESLRKLLIYLIDKHKIPFEKGIYNWDWFEYNASLLEGSGIRTHVQVRKDKTDMFPQKELIDMLNSL